MNNYFEKAAVIAKKLELIDFYKKRNFKILDEATYNDKRYDLLVQSRQGKFIAFDFKIYPVSREEIETVNKRFSESVGDKVDFRLITVVPPRQKEIEIDWISEVLSDYLNENIPDEIESESTHSIIEEVEVEINKIIISNGKADLSLEGKILVELQFGSDGDMKSDNGLRTTFNYDFECELKIKLNSKEIEDIQLTILNSYLE